MGGGHTCSVYFYQVSSKQTESAVEVLLFQTMLSSAQCKARRMCLLTGPLSVSWHRWYHTVSLNNPVTVKRAHLAVQGQRAHASNPLHDFFFFLYSFNSI